MVRAAQVAGFERVIGFDMGGTSTDVSHYHGEFERVFETQVAGVRMRAPMMSIHTVAAGGGSVLGFDGARLRVSSNRRRREPGAGGHRRGGPLTVTDCNVMLGKIQPDHFRACSARTRTNRSTATAWSRSSPRSPTRSTRRPGGARRPRRSPKVSWKSRSAAWRTQSKFRAARPRRVALRADDVRRRGRPARAASPTRSA